MSADLAQKTFRNISYNAVAKVVALLFQMAANVILSRNLTSSDYGIVGFAFIFITFLTQFNDLGVNSAVVQRKELDQRGLHTAFTIKSVLAVVLFGLSFVIAPFAPLMFEENEAVTGVIQLLSLTFLINIFNFMPGSMLTRELSYGRLAIIQTGATVVNAVLAIALVLAGYSYWSIVIANVASSVAMVVIANIFLPIRIRFAFDRRVAVEMISFGWKLLVSNILIFVIYNVDNFIIGTTEGSSTLGYYMIAFNWGSVLAVLLKTIVHSVLFPTFSKFQEDRTGLKASYLKSLEYIAFFGVLVNMTLFIVAREFLIQVLGQGTEKWLPALVAFKILCIYGIIRSLIDPAGNVVLAVGRSDIQLKANLAAAVFDVALIYPALKFFGIEGVAVVITVAHTMQLLVYLPFLRWYFDIGLGEIGKAVSPSLLSLSTILLVHAGYSYFSPEIGWSVLIEKLVLSVLVYSMIYGLVTRWRLYREVKNLVFAPK